MPGFGFIPQQVDPNDPEMVAMQEQRARDEQLARDRAAMTYAPGQQPAPPVLDVTAPPTPTFDQSQAANYQAQQAAAPASLPVSYATAPVTNDNATTPLATAPAAAGPTIGPDITKTSSYGESYAKPTKDFAGKRDALNSAETADIESAKAAKKSAVADANAEAQGRAADTKAFTDFQADAEAKQAAARQKYEAATSYLAAERERVTKEGTTDYWHDKTDGSRVLAALSAGLGEFAAKLSGGPNTALNVINSAMDRDARLKEKKLAAELENLGISKADAAERLNYARLEIANQKAGLIDRLTMERETRLAKAGIGETERKGDAIINGLAKAKAATDLQIEQGLSHTVTRGGTTTTSNVDQNKALLAAAVGGGEDPYVLRGRDGQPVVTGTREGKPVLIKANDKESAAKVAEMKARFPTTAAGLRDMIRIASTSPGDRVTAQIAGTAAALRHQAAVDLATMENGGQRPSATLIKQEEQSLPDVGVGTSMREVAKTYQAIHDRLQDKVSNYVQAYTNSNKASADRVARDWAGAASQQGPGAATLPPGIPAGSTPIKWKKKDGTVIDAYRLPNGGPVVEAA